MKKRRIVLACILAALALSLFPLFRFGWRAGISYYRDKKETAALLSQTDIVLDYPGTNEFELNGKILTPLPKVGYFMYSGEDRGAVAAIFRYNNRTPALEGLYPLRNGQGFELYEIRKGWEVFCPANQVKPVEAYYNDNASYDMRHVWSAPAYGNPDEKNILLDEGVFEELLRLGSGILERKNISQHEGFEDVIRFLLIVTSTDGAAKKRVELSLVKGQLYAGEVSFAVELPKELNAYMMEVLL